MIREKIPLVVGAIAEAQALLLPVTGCDIIELRLDSLGTGPEVLAFAKNSSLPLLVTARGPLEGGQSSWSPVERIEAYQKLMPYAAAIDIELRDFAAFGNLIEVAKGNGVTIVGSFHDFKETPPLENLLEKLGEQADIHKFALMVNSLECLKRQLSLLESLPERSLSVMGMGELGAAARPLMAKAGSLLNYGFLGETPTAPNQWPAGLLKETLAL